MLPHCSGLRRRWEPVECWGQLQDASASCQPEQVALLLLRQMQEQLAQPRIDLQDPTVVRRNQRARRALCGPYARLVRGKRRM